MKEDTGLFRVEMRYRTAKGRKWKTLTRTFKLSRRKFEELSNKPIEDSLRHLLLPARETTIDYFIITEVER